MASAEVAMAASRIGRLPAEVDTFVGRRRELEEIRRLFTDHPLVTLIGLGGVGKTRLVLRAASQMSRVFSGGTWFVELGELQDSALLLAAVADAVGLREQSTSLTLDALIEHLSTRHALLVLDNCEHLVEEVATLSDKLLRNCPEVRLLVTSRERLGIHGEGTLQVTPLAVPSAADTLQSLPRFDAINLFTERARAIRPEFTLTEQNGPDVARICRELDGLPLALELAAARLQTISPRELAARLADRFRVLTGGSRAAPPRHQTMRMCVDWSYEQCSPEERLLWSRLSVFVGSFELDAVEGTCAFGGLSVASILDVLSSLVEKSIVSRDGPDSHTQFRLLETLREYGLERLEMAGEVAVMRRRHRDWYDDMVMQLSKDLVSDRQLEWIQRMDRELPNVRVALEYSLNEPAEAPVAQRIAGNLHLFWISRGFLSEGRYWLGRATMADSTPSLDRTQALFCIVSLACFQGDLHAVKKSVKAGVADARTLGDEVTRAYAVSTQAMYALFTGDLRGAVTFYVEAAAMHHATGNTLREVEILIGLALASGLLGEYEQAAATHEQILSITEPRGETWYRGYSLWALGVAEWRRGRHDRAAELLEQSLRLRRQMSDLMGSAWCVEALAFVADVGAEPERAAVLLGASSAMSDAAGTPPATFPDLVTASAKCEGVVRGALGEGAFERAFARGVAMTVDEAVAFALREELKREQPTRDPWSALTRRERQVAELVASGLSNRAIAEKLVISPRTAENHVEKVLSKLGLNSRTQVAAWAAEQTLAENPGEKMSSGQSRSTDS